MQLLRNSLMTQKEAETKETSGWLPWYSVPSDIFAVPIIRGQRSYLKTRRLLGGRQTTQPWMVERLTIRNPSEESDSPLSKEMVLPIQFICALADQHAT